MPAADAADVAAYLKALGLDGIETFTSRLRIQKSVFLLNEFGAHLPFEHHWYVHGPYSPGLTRELFAEANQPTNARALGADELQIVNTFRKFLGESFYSVDDLELLVSLIYLIEHGPREGYESKKEIIGFLREAKPHFATEQVEAAWDKIEKAGFWKVYLVKVKH